jgi:hypothetical protein
MENGPGISIAHVRNALEKLRDRYFGYFMVMRPS